MEVIFSIQDENLFLVGNLEFLDQHLSEIEKGKIQLPDFQRGWVWDDSHIRSLIASVTLSYPVGAVMLMETGGEGVRFKPRMIEGASLTDPPNRTGMLRFARSALTASSA